MKLKSRILLSVLSVLLFVTTNLGVSAAKHIINDETLGFAKGIQISDKIKNYYFDLSKSNCTESDINRITAEFIEKLGTILNTVTLADPNSKIVPDLNNKISRIGKIKKRLIGWLHGMPTNKKGKQIFKTSQQIRNYCLGRLKIKKRCVSKNLDDFVVDDDDESLYPENSSSSNSDSESSDSESSSSSSSDSESSDSESSSSSSSDSESSDSESSSSNSSDSESSDSESSSSNSSDLKSSDLKNQKSKRKPTYILIDSDVESNSNKKLKI